VLVCLTLTAWFLSQWLIFQLRVRLNVRGLTLERVLQTARGEVDSVWTRQKIDVRVTLAGGGILNLPYGIVSERLPGLATFQEGTLRVDGTLGKESPLTLTYSIFCAAPGRLRFEGVKIEFSDLQGFFVFSTFVQAPSEHRVLPALAVEASMASFVKHHNVLPLLGTHRHARPGGSSELLDLRDYMPGDPPKLIAWKLSARRDRLITKEFESEVPIRCTIFLDTSNSVRVGAAGETALCRLVEIAAGLTQANASERDLTGLCAFDETGISAQLKPGRGPKHMVRMLDDLTRLAGLMPRAAHAAVRDLVPTAFGLAQDVYPEYLEDDVNTFPWWLPFWAPQPGWSMPPDAPRYWSRLSPALHEEYRRRKQLAAILSVRYELGPGGLALLLEDDRACADCLQRFLAEHQVPVPLPLYDEAGNYQFAAPQKAKVLADALMKAVIQGKDNELYVLCLDLLESEDKIAPLEKAICVARGRHHQVLAVAPWPRGVAAPGRLREAPIDFEKLDARELLQRAFAERMHEAFARVQRALGRLGVPVICAAQDDSIDWILHRMRRLRIQERGVR
jgi:uncharacterized protein (DUF58 family)